MKTTNKWTENEKTYTTSLYQFIQIWKYTSLSLHGHQYQLHNSNFSSNSTYQTDPIFILIIPIKVHQIYQFQVISIFFQFHFNPHQSIISITNFWNDPLHFHVSLNSSFKLSRSSNSLYYHLPRIWFHCSQTRSTAKFTYYHSKRPVYSKRRKNTSEQVVQQGPEPTPVLGSRLKSTCPTLDRYISRAPILSLILLDVSLLSMWLSCMIIRNNKGRDGMLSKPL